MILTRRQLFKSIFGATAAVGTGLGLYAWRVEPHWVQVVVRDLPIAHLPDSLRGRTLLQLSDLHVGPVVDSDYLATALRTASALEPDIVVLTGDFMSCHGMEQIERLASAIRDLSPAKLATLAVLGNHDYAAHWSDEAVADSLTSALEHRGIRVLRNALFDLEGLQIAGLDDFWGPNFDPPSALAQLDNERARLVLCHNPDSVDLDVWGSYRGWILCGHTHGGQCDPPLLAPPLLPISNPKYASGEVDLGDGRFLYVNRGIGYSRRVRFNARPEITVFRLTTV